MRDKLGNLTIRNLIIVYILLYSIMPIVGRLTSRYLTTYFYMAVVVALVLLILVLDRPDNLGSYGMFLLPFIIYGALTYFYNRSTIIMWGYQTLLFWLPVILGYYFTQDKTRILGSYSRIIILAIVVTMVTTIIGCIQNPNAARILASVNSGDVESYTYDMMNIGGYDFVYIMILLYPVLILSYKTKRIGVIPTIVIAAVILATVIYSEYTTALLLFLVSSVLFFTKRNLSSRGIVVITIFAILFALVFSNFLSGFLNWLSDLLGSETLGMRLKSLAGGAAGLEQSEDERLKLYGMSLNTFFTNPLFGNIFSRYRSDGGHSFILDNLAMYGALGGALMVFMYKNIFQRFFQPFKDKPGYGYIVWTFIQAIILSFVNTGMWLEVLCLFAPLLFYWIYGTEEVKNEDTVDSQFSSGSAGREAIRKTE